MKAVRVARWATPPSIEEVPVPDRADGHTLVRIHAAAVGHVDRTIWSGGFLRHPPLPYTPGVEGAGVVVESDRFEAGTKVWLRGGGLGTTTDGTWAEFALAPDGSIGPLPPGVAEEVAAAFFSPCTSAWIALYSVAQVAEGQHVLVTGGAGAVGSVAVQLALRAGARVTATVSSPARLGAVPAGAHGVVVDGRVGVDHDELARPPIDVLVDTVGGDVLGAVLPAVRPGGRAVLVGYVAGTALTIDIPTFLQRDVSVHPLNMIRREAEGRAAAPSLLAHLADGSLSLEVTPFPIERAADALDWLVEPGHAGRAVLRPWPRGDEEATPA